MLTKRYRSIRKTQPFIYLDIQLEFASNEIKHKISIREFKLIVMTAFQSLFGDFGTKTQFDLIKYRETDFRAFIRTNAQDLVRVRNSLTLYSEWNQNECTFRIHRISHSLSSLSIQSLNHLKIE